MRFRGSIAAAFLAVAGAASVAVALAADGKLTGTVGPGFTIGLLGADGLPVQRLDPGTYELAVDDRSPEHNFHLSGPGVDVVTSVEDVGAQTFTITLKDGRYTFLCDPHSNTMRGAFDVGTGPPLPPPSPPPVAAKKLTATVGPGATISLRTPASIRVRALRAGAYIITVRDRTKLHNFHLTGAGVNRKTGIAQVATVTWKLTLKRGTLVFRSDKSPVTLRGTVAVT